MKIAFIGLGHMGEPMAHLLLKAGYSLSIYNRSLDKTAALERKGAAVAATPSAASAGADMAISMLADDAAVRDVTLGQDGIAAGLRPGSVHISSSTISTQLARDLAAEHQQRGQAFITAAVLGRPESVEAGKAWILAAGPSATIARCRPALDALGQGVLEAGEEPWRANLVKISLNFVLASSLEMFGEVFALIEKSGFDRVRFLEILTQALLKGPALQSYAERIARCEFDPAGFYLKHGLKDTRLALAAGDEAVVPLPLANILRDHYLEAVARGDADLDWSAVSDSPRWNAGIRRVTA